MPGPTSTHIFCGAGGDTAGLAEAGFTPILAANHAPTAIETHAANFPHCEHLCADINNYDMRRLPRTQVLWGSPICTEGSPAGGNATPQTQPSLIEEEGHVPAATWERTRATAYDLLRAAEVHHYDAILWENVVDFATRWPLYDWWLKAWELLGYVPQVASVDAAHLGGAHDSSNPRASQNRNRLVGAMVRKGIKAPDLRVRPEAVCGECGPVRGIQRWRNPRGRKVGRYSEQYDYVCPNRTCGHRIVAPITHPVADVIDWTLPGRRIGDGKATRVFKPYAANTRARIQAGLDQYAGDPFLAILRRNCTAQPLTRPVGTITAGGNHHALIIHIGRNTGPRSTAEPLTTVATKAHHSLVRPAAAVDDCTIRMLNAREKARAQRFPRDYILRGTVAEQGVQVGNAVPVNAAHWIGERVAAVLA